MIIKPIYKNKKFGAALLLFSLFCFAVIIHRLSHYVYEFDPEFSPVDYGQFNILSFFTVQSNILVAFYLLLTSLAVFGNEKAQKIAFNPTFGSFVTTYILVTGAVYCCGIPLGFTPPFKWYDPHHFMLSFIQVLHHMIIPPLMLILWLIPPTDKKVNKKKIWAVGIYPLVYSAFSIIRGAVSDPEFYAYPFYKPNFLWDMLLSGKPINLALAYVMMIPELLIGISLFIIICEILSLIRNRMVEIR